MIKESISCLSCGSELWGVETKSKSELTSIKYVPGPCVICKNIKKNFISDGMGKKKEEFQEHLYLKVPDLDALADYMGVDREEFKKAVDSVKFDK